MRETKEREDLADYIRRVRRASHWSCADISNRARQKGHAISTSYITRLENRLALRPSTDKLAALAAGLEVAAPEIFAVARGESIDNIHEASLLSVFRSMPASTREDLYSIAVCLAERHAKPKKNPADD